MKKKILLITSATSTVLLGLSFVAIKNIDNKVVDGTEYNKYKIDIYGDSISGINRTFDDDTWIYTTNFNITKTFKVGTTDYTIESVSDFTYITSYYDYDFNFKDGGSIGTATYGIDSYFDLEFSFCFKILTRATFDLVNSGVYYKKDDGSKYDWVRFSSIGEEGEYTYYVSDEMDIHTIASGYGKTGRIDFIRLEFKCEI